jgi:hypothetical protein
VSFDKFEDNCEGCRPACINPETGEVLAEDDPVMIAINRVWESTTLEERKAFHDVCCLNSRNHADLAHVNQIVTRVKAAQNAN